MFYLIHVKRCFCIEKHPSKEQIMARPRKTLKFAEVLNPLGVADLKQLKNEITAEIRIKERESIKVQSEDNARKIRDKIRIGNKVTFNQRGAGGGSVKAEVIGIFADKVQVEVDGRKRSVSLTRVANVE
jgi:hypothetical protein